MKTWKLLLCLLFSWVYAKAQDNTYSYTDYKALQIPDSSTYSTAGIADYINSNFIAEKEKIRAAYSWVTANIRYSKDSMFYRYWGDDPERKLASVLKTRKGVCEDYATLFTAIVLKCHIPSFVVRGITKTAGTVSNTAHSWCAVHVDQQWLLCDPTWDEGFQTATHFFLISPDQFIESHFPFDPLWQLLEHPLTNNEFTKQGYTAAKKDTGVFHYADSANAFLQLDTLQQQEAASARMRKAGLDNESMQTWYAYNQMKISIVYQENDMTIFNAAVANLNKAKSLYNDFIDYRNRLFKPAKPDLEMNIIFQPIDSLITAAGEKAVTIGKKTENYQYDTEGLQNSLDLLSKKVREQKDFLNGYLNASPAERVKLFYQ